MTIGLCALSLATSSMVSLGSKPNVNVSKKFPVGSRISIDTMIETEQEPALGGTPTMHVGVEGFDRD